MSDRYIKGKDVRIAETPADAVKLEWEGYSVEPEKAETPKTTK